MVQVDAEEDADDDGGQAPANHAHLLHQMRGVAVEDLDECQVHVPCLQGHPRDRRQEAIVEQGPEELAGDFAGVTELGEDGVGEEADVHECESDHEVEEHAGTTVASKLPA